MKKLLKIIVVVCILFLMSSCFRISVKSSDGKTTYTQILDACNDHDFEAALLLAKRCNEARQNNAEIYTIFNNNFEENCNFLLVYEKEADYLFTLTDYLDQMAQIKSMGSVQDIAGMLPGVDASALSGAQVDEKALARQEAIILSMTPDERENPGKLNSSRKKRIAAGSGTAVVDVNRVLKQYETMQQMVKQLNSKSMKKKQKRMGRMGGGFPGLPGGFGF